jgi:hypothetical protein
VCSDDWSQVVTTCTNKKLTWWDLEDGEAIRDIEASATGAYTRGVPVQLHYYTTTHFTPL